MREPEALHVFFSFHPEKCTGCGACVTACMDEHSDFNCVLRRLYQQEKWTRRGWKLEWSSVGCMHCNASECARVCPRKCFSLDAETGTIQLDSAACVGCGACRRVCPFDAITITADRKADKCDGCIQRLREGLLPRCVAACPQYAITVDDRPALREQLRAELIQWLQKEKTVAIG